MSWTMKLIKALADESRVRVLWMLEERSLCVCEMQESLGLSQSSVSRHLQILEEAGFIVSERRGPWKDYNLNSKPTLLAQGLLAQIRVAALLEPEAKRVREMSANVCREEICGGGRA
ncbi:MAG: transcriptional regulator [Deltaproteobacteria bacterium]|nr:MAG: transcriptional regulator [Deltaproteobacteria bacterium]